MVRLAMVPELERPGRPGAPLFESMEGLATCDRAPLLSQ
jgi:hypothetical protein